MKPRYIEKYAAALDKLGRFSPDAPQGVLDIGSNSVRLVGFSGSARTPLPIYNERAFCRLGASVSASGRIEGAPRDLALQTFQRFNAIAKQLGIENLAAFATAAVREAENSAEFVAEAEQLLGHKIRVLSGQEEAFFSADGVMLGIPNADGLVADLGGGSLELVRVRDNEVHNWASLPLGVLALQRAGDDDLARIRAIVEAALSELDWLGENRALPIYIVGGTWRALAKAHMGHTDYGLEVLHQYEMPAASAKEFCTLLQNDGVKIKHLSSDISGNRRDSLPVAALVLDCLMQRTDPSQLVVSANAVREGVLYAELKSKYRKLDPLIMACEEMAGRLCKSESYGHELAVWTDKLFAHAAPQHFSVQQIERLRIAACLISDLAWSSHPSFRAETVWQTVLTAPFAGVSHAERLFMARGLAARHEARHEMLNLNGVDLAAQDDALAQALGLSLRLAHSLSASLPGVLQQTRLDAQPTKLVLTLTRGLAALNAPIIEKRLGVLANMMGLQPVIEERDQIEE